MACDGVLSPTPTPTSTPTPTPTPVPIKQDVLKIEAGGIQQFAVGLAEGDRLYFSFKADLDINVRLVGPFGRELGSWERVKALGERNVTATTSGVHTLTFDNAFSVFTSKTVTLKHRVVPPGGR